LRFARRRGALDSREEVDMGMESLKLPAVDDASAETEAAAVESEEDLVKEEAFEPALIQDC
jgi:hypothetical protein